MLCGIDNDEGMKKGTFTAVGINALSDALKGNTTLTSLNLDHNNLTDYGNDMSGILRLAEALPHSQLTSLSLHDTDLTGNGEDMSGILKLVEALPHSQLTSLSLGENDLTNRRRGMDMSGILKLAEVLPHLQLTSLSVDGHPLPIDELKGTKPVESIDLSREEGEDSWKQISVASCIIIAACIKENAVLKELNLDDNYLIGNCRDMSGILKLADVLPHSQLTSLSLQNNYLDDAAKQAIRAASGSRVELAL